MYFLAVFYLNYIKIDALDEINIFGGEDDR